MPLVEVVTALAVLAVAGLAWLTVREARAVRLRLRALATDSRRQQACCSEAEAFVRSRTRIADAAISTAEAVQRGSAVTQAGHQLIAAIPFAILGRIPATRRRSDQVRQAHDGTADKVYDGISTFADRISAALRLRLIGPED